MIPHPQSYQTIHELELRALAEVAAREHLADLAAPPATPRTVVAELARRIAGLAAAALAAAQTMEPYAPPGETATADQSAHLGGAAKPSPGSVAP